MTARMDSLLEPLERGERRAALRAPVLLAVALDQTYDYLLPDGRRAGARRLRAGAVRAAEPHRRGLGLRPSASAGKPVADKKLKTITARSPTCRRCRPVAALCRMDRALHARAARHGGAHDDGRRAPCSSRSKPRFGVDAATTARREPPRMTPARKRALEIAADGLIRAKAALAAEAAMLDRRHRRPGRGRHAGRGGDPRAAPARARSRATPRPTSPTRRPAPCMRMRAAADGGSFSVTLLDGVTGSGKTEVYFEAVARTPGEGAAGADHAARDRAHQPVHGPLHRALRLPAGRMAFGAVVGPSAAAPGAPRPTGRRASWSAPARRCSCPSRSSA